MSAITKDRLLTIKQWRETYGPGSNVVLPAEEAEELARIALASLEREQIRHEHAKWPDSTFGCVGPIGPLKHLSKEALEAAAEPDDLSEWADMQFLLWDAQRRAGISDAEINVAMEDKLKINMERQWPEPKDGEPRLHIKEPGNSPVTP
ncbi:dATP/dGTP pyrophosphohydrolase domain-containing protein, partial [Escherichia coli]